MCVNHSIIVQKFRSIYEQIKENICYYKNLNILRHAQACLKLLTLPKPQTHDSMIGLQLKQEANDDVFNDAMVCFMNIKPTLLNNF